MEKRWCVTTEMPTIVDRRSSPVAIIEAEIGDSTLYERKLRSNSAAKDDSDSPTPLPMQSSSITWKLPRRCLNDSPKTNTPSKEIGKLAGQKGIDIEQITSEEEVIRQLS